ncbi:hypothetical protein [Aquimarina latercula]|uniref:hypothetical protein n=1 Tax=Aquimarina latercula TaxID=987 RepID=UPI0004281B7D|nr:hypothetical protein [Aquimarina latercula]
MKINVIDKQNVFDITLQGYGTITEVFQVALQNGMGITDTIPAGTTIEIPENQQATDPEVLEYYNTYKVRPVTEVSQIVQTIEPSKGIGSMIIKETFIVG